MKLSEIDKNKLPIKVVCTDGDEPTVFTIKYLSDYLAVLEFDNGYETPAPIHLDIWSLHEEPKTKVALYMYKHEGDTRWTLRDIFFKDDKDFKYSRLCHEGTEFKRLVWSEIEI